MSVIDAGRIETSDADEHAEAVEPWEVRFHQITPGGFRGRIDYVRTAGVTLYRERWNQTIAMTGQSPAGYHIFGAPVDPAARVVWCGDVVSEQRFGTARSASDVDFTCSEIADHCIVMVQSDRLARYLGGTEEADTSTRHMDCHPELGRRLLVAIDSMIAEHTSRPGLADDARAGTELEFHVLGALAHCANWGPGPGADQPRRLKALQRAVDYVASQHEQISIPQLAAAAEVSQRTLEYAFREELGVTPLQFLRRFRMNGAHRALRAADPSSTTVTRVALDRGFTELGRFAGEYRRMFGVSPSQTLGKSRSALRHLHEPQPSTGRGAGKPLTCY